MIDIIKQNIEEQLKKMIGEDIEVIFTKPPKGTDIDISCIIRKKEWKPTK